MIFHIAISRLLSTTKKSKIAMKIPPLKLHRSRYPRSIANMIAQSTALLLTNASWAVPIAIINPSFEMPAQGFGQFANGVADGWNVVGSSSAGVWWRSSGPGAPDGVQQAYITSGSGYPGGSMSQTLADQLQPNTAYTLSLDVTAVPGFVPDTTYSISLLANGIILATIPPAAIISDLWTTISTTYTTGASVPAGQSLGISISYYGQVGYRTELEFDNVRLNASPINTSVPDGGNTLFLSSFALLGIFTLNKYMARQSTVH